MFNKGFLFVAQIELGLLLCMFQGYNFMSLQNMYYYTTATIQRQIFLQYILLIFNFLLPSVTWIFEFISLDWLAVLLCLWYLLLRMRTLNFGCLSSSSLFSMDQPVTYTWLQKCRFHIFFSYTPLYKHRPYLFGGVAQWYSGIKYISFKIL